MTRMDADALGWGTDVFFIFFICDLSVFISAYQWFLRGGKKNGARMTRMDADALGWHRWGTFFFYYLCLI